MPAFRCNKEKQQGATKMINTVYELITDVMAKQYPDRVAFRYVAADGKTVVEKTYAQYVQDIRRAVTYFKENIPDIKGKRVGIMSRNCYEYGVNSFGAILAGAVVVTINQKKTWPELEYELGLVEPALILNDGIDYGCRAELEAAYGPKLRPMDCYKDTAPGELTNCVGHDDLMMLMFTSGTTGRSKGVMLSERNFFTVMQMHVAMGDHLLDFKHGHLPEDKNDVLSNFAILPLFHLGTFICLFVWACKGWALNLCGDIRDFYRDLGLMHSDVMASAPMLVETIYNDMKRGRVSRLNGLWDLCCSSAALDPKMLLELAQNGFVVNQCYGMTETFGDGILNFTQVEKHMSAVGKPDDHVQYKLDETGEICIKGDCVMLGYYKDPEATAEVLDADGWFHTGDLAVMQPDGYIKIKDRSKDVIISGGENISSIEVEDVLYRHPAVSAAAVIAMPDPKWGEVPCAFLELKDGVETTEEAVIEYCREHLARFKVPKKVIFGPLPKTSTGKLQKYLLRQQMKSASAIG